MKIYYITPLLWYQQCHTVAIPDDTVLQELGLRNLTPSKNPDSDGPIQTSFPGKVNAINALGHELTENVFSGSSIGGFVNNPTFNGAAKERSYSANAYFKPVQSRPNLHLVAGAQAEKIILEKESDEAIAKVMKATINDIEHFFQVGKEIIVAAGALNSPKILELSGIGDPELLPSFGIDLYFEIPRTPT